jgi:hypothetical protein
MEEECELIAFPCFVGCIRGVRHEIYRGAVGYST